jgi:hypothetical protein
MLTHSRLVTIATSLLSMALFAPAQAMSINKSIEIAAGSESSGQSSVNGSITVGNEARVSGALETVNGAIRIGERAVVGDLQTVNGGISVGASATAGDIDGVNGSIRLARQVRVTGAISVVNGRITVADGSRIDGNVSNVNGELQVLASEIGGNLSTVNGDVLLTDRSIVTGDLVVEKPSGWNWKNQREPRVVIGPGAVVEGKLRLERRVGLFIHDSARVGGVTGEMRLDDAVRFSGDRP